MYINIYVGMAWHDALPVGDGDGAATTMYAGPWINVYNSIAFFMLLILEKAF